MTLPKPKQPPVLTINSTPKRPKEAQRAVFDRATADIEDADDHNFDLMKNEGQMDEDYSLNEASSAMSDQPSNGPNNHFNKKFNE